MKFSIPEIKVITLDVEDVLTTSGVEEEETCEDFVDCPTETPEM